MHYLFQLVYMVYTTKYGVGKIEIPLFPSIPFQCFASVLFYCRRWSDVWSGWFIYTTNWYRKPQDLWTVMHNTQQVQNLTIHLPTIQPPKSLSIRPNQSRPPSLINSTLLAILSDKFTLNFQYPGSLPFSMILTISLHLQIHFCLSCITSIQTFSNLHSLQLGPFLFTHWSLFTHPRTF